MSSEALERKYDVVVAGAGPAGSVLSRLLALQGAKVLMVDAAPFPRRKPCGESLNPGAVQTLSRLYDGRQADEWLHEASIPHSVLTGWQLNSAASGSGRMTTLAASFGDNRYGIGCKRELLDGWLIEQAYRAGVVFEEKTKAERLIWENGRLTGVEVRRTSDQRPQLVRTQMVAGADGIRSAVARSADLSRFGKLRKAALTARLNGIEGLSGKVELYVSGDRVIGLAPIGGGQANMTVALRGRKAMEGAAAGKSAYMMSEARQWEALKERFHHAEIEGEVLACGPFERIVRSAALEGMVLVGDAAGYYDPMTGQGIYRALRSAELAAPALMDALQTGSHRSLQWYNRQRLTEFAGSLRLQKLIEQASRHERLWRAGLRVIGASEALTNRLVAAIGDSRPVHR
ncbi:NAD(P)/FAD-dependent oxidoreductase [Paenibacillus radicis (ex Gao et al. 2016)]|uniref:Oxidoreductase n=1 Tax=Paenibacillus radicis (ex Gao et al. 2016) TaxID=1737354 RepID=A0A917HSP4_9BACL|nr:NAD(P)/FAD-dependent oxidoreductase [Paenibacillus radicis (ex Gao et al. 2016)]GGG88836.1 putative oxidoreductase [Paenibacillus radicis (ex Gao et al. 2016)]